MWYWTKKENCQPKDNVKQFDWNEQQSVPRETAPLIKSDAIFRDLWNPWDLFKCSRLADFPLSAILLIIYSFTAALFSFNPDIPICTTNIVILQR